jgi:hypothetical protein
MIIRPAGYPVHPYIYKSTLLCSRVKPHQNFYLSTILDIRTEDIAGLTIDSTLPALFSAKFP